MRTLSSVLKVLLTEDEILLGAYYVPEKVSVKVICNAFGKLIKYVLLLPIKNIKSVKCTF